MGVVVLTMQVPFPPVITGPAQSCVWLLTSMLCFMLYISWQCRLFTTVNCTCLNLSCRGPFIIGWNHFWRRILILIRIRKKKITIYFWNNLSSYLQKVVSEFRILVSMWAEFLSHSEIIMKSSDLQIREVEK